MTGTAAHDVLPLEIAKLDLHPGEVVVLKMSTRETAAVAERVQAQLAGVLPAGVRALVLHGDQELFVLNDMQISHQFVLQVAARIAALMHLTQQQPAEGSGAV